jgi:hypothetical protein
MRSRLEIIMGYLKKISARDSNNMKYYDEMEWRVVHLEYLELKGYIAVQDKKSHIYRLLVKPQDIKVIVFPDEETKQMAIMDKFILDYFKDRQPIMTALPDCAHF